MNLYKCFNPSFIDNEDECLTLWAIDKETAKKICIEIVKSLDIYDNPEEFVLSEWQIEQYFPSYDSEVYKCIPREITKADDIQLVFVPFDVKNVEEYILDRLAEFESQEPYFQDHVLDRSINCSFNERFYCDDKGWMFSNAVPLIVRKDIKVKSAKENMSVDQYIDEFWLSKVNEFFKDYQEFRNQYIQYITNDGELDDEFFFYVAKKLMNTGEWITYEDIQKVEVY